MTKIAVLVGSIRQKSYNGMLARAIERMAGDLEFVYIDIGGFPLFSEDVEAVAIPDAVAKAKQTVEAADGVLFVTPEYNRSIPGPLKNAIDWISRPWGFNSFQGKPVGIIGTTITPTGTVAAQAALQNVLIYLDTKLLGQPELYIANAQNVFNEEGDLIDERWRKNLGQYMERYADWITQ